MIFEVIALIASMALILKSSDFLLDAGIRISKRTGASEFVIGLIVLAVGTSLPELFTSTTSALLGQTGISTGTIIGANMLNITLILGAAILIMPSQITSLEWSIQGFIMALVSLMFMALVVDGLTRVEGIFMLLLFIVYIFALVKFSPTHKASIEEAAQSRGKQRHLIFDIGVSILSLTGLIVGTLVAIMAVRGIALEFGISVAIVSSILMAMGTTIPEFVITLKAAQRRSTGVLLGMLMGANITNILLILGLGAALSPFPLPEPAVLFLLPFFVVAPLLVVIYLTKPTGFPYGVILILYYIFFLLVTTFSSFWPILKPILSRG